jgi:hypothetical protein
MVIIGVMSRKDNRVSSISCSASPGL